MKAHVTLLAFVFLLMLTTAPIYGNVFHSQKQIFVPGRGWTYRFGHFFVNGLYGTEHLASDYRQYRFNDRIQLLKLSVPRNQLVEQMTPERYHHNTDVDKFLRGESDNLYGYDPETNF